MTRVSLVVVSGNGLWMKVIKWVVVVVVTQKN